MSLDYKSIGIRIKNARVRKGLTQEKLAELAELSPSHMSNIETGTTRVSLSSLVNLANILSVTVDDLLCDNLVQARPTFEKRIKALLDDCNDYEIRMVEEMIAALLKTTRRQSAFLQQTTQNGNRD